MTQATPPDQKASTPRPKKRIGFMEGEFELPDDFDTTFQAEIEEMFYGGSIEPEYDPDEPDSDEPPRKP